MKPLRIALLSLGLLTVATPALACLWDRDTLATELKGMPDIAHVATGRFEQFPPLYYEQRLERCVRAHAEDPMDLEVYDDAAVALDRLGRHDEAIEWMAKKKLVLTETEDEALAKTHRYRYLANLGTFHAHRWLYQGADRANTADLQKARDLVAQAIQENPDAHFGRERYQLRILEFFLSPVTWDNRRDVPNVIGLKPKSAMESRGYLKEQGLPDAVEGLAGLVTMGAAWRSVDVFHALALTLETDGRNSAAHLMRLRINELIDDGRGSLVAPTAKGDTLKKLLTGRHSLLEGHDQAALKAWYVKARAEAELWRAEREQYLMERLERGIHPDTHPDFWAEFHPSTTALEPLGGSAGGDHPSRGGRREAKGEWQGPPTNDAHGPEESERRQRKSRRPEQHDDSDAESR